MKLPHLKKQRSVKKYHGSYDLIDDYGWVDQPNVLEVLKREGYIRGFSSIEHKPGIRQLKIDLKYQEGVPVISSP